MPLTKARKSSSVSVRCIIDGTPARVNSPRLPVPLEAGHFSPARIIKRRIILTNRNPLRLIIIRIRASNEIEPRLIHPVRKVRPLASLEDTCIYIYIYKPLKRRRNPSFHPFPLFYSLCTHTTSFEPLVDVKGFRARVVFVAKSVWIRTVTIGEGSLVCILVYISSTERNLIKSTGAYCNLHVWCSFWRVKACPVCGWMMGW